MRSSGHPCSRSPAPIVAASSWLCPVARVSLSFGCSPASRCIYLEGKVLQEVCSAICLVGLGSGPGVDPHSYCRGLGPWRVFGSDLESRRVRHSYIEYWRDQLVVGGRLTVRPFFNVVVWVFAPTGDDTGVAKPRFNELRAGAAARLRMPWARFKASLRDAIGTVMDGGWGED